MTLRRGFSLENGERVAIVEDVVTTGKSSREVMELVRARGAEPVALLSIVNRSSESLDMGVPVYSLLKLAIPSYAPEACPLCKDGKPFVKPGSRTAPR
jgi:orotate phosphoribosyltransferase